MVEYLSLSVRLSSSYVNGFLSSQASDLL